MTPKEKAEELYSKMYGGTPIRAVIAEIEEDKQCAKQCALIAVDEIINTYHSPMDDEQIQEWQQVKQEIEKL